MTENAVRPVALITGASSGIGRELAREFAEHGYDLVIAAEDERIAEAARELSATGAHVEAERVDLRRYDGVELLWKAVQASGRPLAAVAINAGIGTHGPFVETDLRADLDTIELNVSSAVHLAKLALAEMTARGEGDVLITSSIAATMPFLYQFAEALRYELKDTGVNVTAVLPGPTDTDFFRRSGAEDTRLGT